MAYIKGDLTLMPLPDILQWIEISNKTGTLTITDGNIKKRFYLQDGKIIFVSSNKKEERVGECILKKKLVDSNTLKKALQKSRHLGIPFTGYLISEGLIDLKTLETILKEMVEAAFLDTLRWEGGIFEFVDSVPPNVINGPVKLSISFMLLQSLKLFDESKKSISINEKRIIKKISDDISAGRVDLPPVPDIVMKLNKALERDDTSTNEIVKIIMADQILTSKILKIVNSAYYAKHGRITSLHQAVLYIGLKSLISVATVHALSGISPHNVNKVKNILKHSLTTAFIARALAPYCAEDPEEAFVCGLLHDIGKTVLLENINHYRISDEALNEILKDFHAEVGALLAEKWKFSDVIKTTIKFHHAPEDSEKYHGMLKLIASSDRIANNSASEEIICSELSTLKETKLDREKFLAEIQKFSKEADLFIS